MHTNLTQLENRLSGEANVDPICALDEQIKGLEKTLTELKRTRNSLLNIHKLPPELLGKIFRRNVMLEGDFGGLEEGSHNFLFVCHHWFEVASNTPELWGFWGNTPEDWTRWYPFSATAPLDLVLSGIDPDGRLNPTLFNVLQDRASRGTVRRVHLRSDDTRLLNTILSSLTSGREGIQSNRMESFLLWNWDQRSMDVSKFFTHHYFPKLQRLCLINCTISSWDLLRSRTGELTKLHFDSISPSPTQISLLSILASNPALQEVTLLRQEVINDRVDASSFRAPLHHLRQLHLSGELRHVFGLLRQLDHPEALDKLVITLHNCTDADIPLVIGPHLRSYLQRRGRTPTGLELSLSSGDRIHFKVGDVGRVDKFVGMDKVVALTVWLDHSIPEGLLVKAALDLLAYVPRKEVVYFRGADERAGMCGAYTQLPNLTTLCLADMRLPAMFPEPDSIENEGIPLSLQTLDLRNLTVDYNDWEPLTTFLARRASSGKPLNTLKVSSYDHICSVVVRNIKRVVQEFSAEEMDPLCPFGICPGSRLRR